MSLASAYGAAGSLRESVLHQIQRAIIATFRAGPVPRHVAFVMDGNRRYARSQGKHVFEGHLNGFYALRRVRDLECLGTKLSLNLRADTRDYVLAWCAVRLCICICDRQLQTTG